MYKTLVKINDLVDVALNRLDVLDLTALRTLLHILVRELDLENCKVEIPYKPELVRSILAARSPMAISEYNAGILVPRAGSRRSDNTVIKIQQMRIVSDLIDDENGLISNILYEIFTRTFVPEKCKSRKLIYYRMFFTVFARNSNGSRWSNFRWQRSRYIGYTAKQRNYATITNDCIGYC